MLEVKKYNIMMNSQLNLSLEKIQSCPSIVRRERRLRRARLWFDHMRSIVDSAPEPSPRQDVPLSMAAPRGGQ